MEPALLALEDNVLTTGPRGTSPTLVSSMWRAEHMNLVGDTIWLLKFHPFCVFYVLKTGLFFIDFFFLVEVLLIYRMILLSGAAFSTSIFLMDHTPYKIIIKYWPYSLGLCIISLLVIYFTAGRIKNWNISGSSSGEKDILWYSWNHFPKEHLLSVLYINNHNVLVMTNLDSILKGRDITLPTKVHLVKAMIFPVVMYGCESWTIKNAECQRIDAFQLWCWRRLLRVPWTARRSNPSILKEINQSWIFIGRTDAEAEAPILWPPDGEELTPWKRPWCWKRLKAGRESWYHQLNGHEFEQALGVGDGQGSLVYCSAWGPKQSDTNKQLN